ESTRWPDLAVRHKLVERVKLHNTDAAPNIQPFHELRPIPRGQLDAILDPNKAQYQNPGY
ncbi:MAG TPA: RagB/SusD family nutrient uptake outer membrane protein, partial [Chitinophagaceae bacterium]|nr:RagB/SusD family nutrient uptake outer membrane protein [Chitinophagaceae bacterium]